MAHFIEVNRRNYECYREGLKEVAGVDLISYDSTESANYHYVVIDVDDSAAGLNRDELRDILWSENILARRYFYPGCYRMHPYLAWFPAAGQRLPHTERLCTRVLCLPNGNCIGLGAIRAICQVLEIAVNRAAQVRTRLKGRDGRLPPGG